MKINVPIIEVTQFWKVHLTLNEQSPYLDLVYFKKHEIDFYLTISNTGVTPQSERYSVFETIIVVRPLKTLPKINCRVEWNSSKFQQL